MTDLTEKSIMEALVEMTEVTKDQPHRIGHSHMVAVGVDTALKLAWKRFGRPQPGDSPQTRQFKAWLAIQHAKKIRDKAAKP